MRVVLYCADKPREIDLFTAMAKGIRALGDEAEVAEPGAPVDGAEAVAMFGVKAVDHWHAVREAGAVPIMLDKGYVRLGKRRHAHYRVSVGAHQPTGYLMQDTRPPDRLLHLGIWIEPWKEDGKHIVLAGSSAKYHDFHGLPHPTDYAKRVVKELRRHTDRPIVYRPKRSWHEATPVRGTVRSNHREIAGDLKGAHCLVTHGSSACFEAVMFGVPSIVLGDAVARPISSTDLGEVEASYRADDETRVQWLANLAYQQWTLPEFASGEAWRVIRERIAE